MNNKFLLIAGLALAVPAMTILPGCNGGSGGPLTKPTPTPTTNAFAGIRAGGQVTSSTGDVLGTLEFSVADDGAITGTLTAAQATLLSTRAAISGTGRVDGDGNFSITFVVPQNDQSVTYTFTGKLLKSNGVITATNLSYQASNDTRGSFDLTVTAPTPTVAPTAAPTAGNTPAPTATPGGSTGTTDFTFNARTGDLNAASGSLRDAMGAGTRATANNLHALTLTFNSVTSPTNLRNLTITLIKSDEFAVGDTFSLSAASTSPAAGQGTVLYGEGVPTNKAWMSASGQAKITALSGNSATVQLILVRMNPAPLAGPGQTNQATGSFTLLGNGTATLGG